MSRMGLGCSMAVEAEASRVDCLAAMMALRPRLGLGICLATWCYQIPSVLFYKGLNSFLFCGDHGCDRHAAEKMPSTFCEFCCWMELRSSAVPVTTTRLLYS